MDRRGFAALYEAHRRTVLRFVFLRVNDRELAEDLTADVFAIAWEKAGRGVEVNLGWLFRTARNLIGNEYQRRDREAARMRRMTLEEAADVTRWDGGFANTEVRAVLRGLAPADGLVLQLVYWEGLSAREAAEFMGCTVGAVWTRLSRVRQALRDVLGDAAMVRPGVERRGGEVDG